MRRVIRARTSCICARTNRRARTKTIKQARDLYERSLALDPGFAPAWAGLGRTLRVIGKYMEPIPDGAQRAEEAFRRALELNPRLTIAHKLYANLEADTGRAEGGMVRLLEEANRYGSDPELFAGLVHACRYCGLFEASLAAHAEGRRLDPNLATSVGQTMLLSGDIERLVATMNPAPTGDGNPGTLVIGLGMAGRRSEALHVLAGMKSQPQISSYKRWIGMLSAWLEGTPADVIAHIARYGELAILEDPEGIFQAGWWLCDVGEHQRGLPYLERALAKRYYPAPTLIRSAQFDALRGTPAFDSLVNDAEAGRQRALAAFRQAGGARLLGV